MNTDNLDQPWPHPFPPFTASDSAGHTEIHPSMLPPIPMNTKDLESAERAYSKLPRIIEATKEHEAMNTITETLAHLAELEAKATRGLWEIGLVTNDVSFISAGAKTLARLDDEGHKENVAFIVALRNAFPAILAHIRELEEWKENEQARSIHTCHADCQRPECVLRRERDDLRAQLTTAQAEVGRLREALIQMPCKECCGVGKVRVDGFTLGPCPFCAKRDAALSAPVEAEETKYSGHVPCPKCGQVHWMHGNCPAAPTEGGAK